jgi:hypothetical protein
MTSRFRSLLQRFLARFRCDHIVAPPDRKCLKCGQVVEWRPE